MPGTSLSGGQQQRLCVARAIAVRPDIILMDEPCSALDPIATKRIEELITELKAEYTIVIVTHSISKPAAYRIKLHTSTWARSLSMGKQRKYLKILLTRGPLITFWVGLVDFSLQIIVIKTETFN